MHDLQRLLAERITSGLKRKSVVSPSKWAETYRVMGQPFPGPWNFRRHAWLKGMHDSVYEYNVGEKAAQMGFTETMLNICFFHIDIKGVDCLYVLPAKTPDASDFSAARFDSALELSPHLSNLFSEVKNVGHKKAGHTNLYIRGSRSKSGLKSIPVGVLILDEKDEMVQANIPLAKERQSGYGERLTWEISTPTVTDYGIDETFKLSSQGEFAIKCPSCSRSIFLTFENNLKICGDSHQDPRVNQSHLYCHLCNNVLEHGAKPEWLATGEWVHANTDAEIGGWHVSQLYSCTIHPKELAIAYFQAQSNPAVEQEFFNSKLGVPHVVKGAKLQEEDITRCKTNYTQFGSCNHGLITMGADIGKDIHFEITRWDLTSSGSIDVNANAIAQVLKVGTVTNFEDLDELMLKYSVKNAVIDMQPERRKAYEFCSRFYGRALMCCYAKTVSGKRLSVIEEELTVNVDRTSWLDAVLARFHGRKIILPSDIPLDYIEHLTSIVRIYEKDSYGNPVGRYVKTGSKPDHYAHARNYSEIALAVATQGGETQTLVK